MEKVTKNTRVKKCTVIETLLDFLSLTAFNSKLKK